MKFFAAILVFLFVAFILSWGILQAVHGHFWLLGIGALAYVLALSKIGCQPAGNSH